MQPVLKSLMKEKYLVGASLQFHIGAFQYNLFRSRRIDKQDIQWCGVARATLGVANARAPGMGDRPAPDREALSFRDGTRRAQDGAAGRAVTVDPKRRER